MITYCLSHSFLTLICKAVETSSFLSEQVNGINLTVLIVQSLRT